MADQPPLVRQWILLRTLCARRYGATVKEIAQELSVSEKTVRRDLETFQKAGFPLEEIVGERGVKKWRVEPAKNQPGLTFAYDEAVALYLGRRLLDPLAGTPFFEAAQRAFRKIRATLGASALAYLEQFGQLFHQTMMGTGDYSGKGDLIDELLIGIEDCKAVFLTYQSLRATEPVTYDVYPYGLVYHRGSLYLVGWSPDHEQVRHWKVDRIEGAEVTKFPFQRPPDFDLQSHLADSFGVFHKTGNVKVKVRFAPRVARYVRESKWHDSQRITPQKDGSVIAEFQLAGTEEIKQWVLSFGRHAVVLAPASLREEIQQDLNALLRAYEEQPTAASTDGRPPQTQRSADSRNASDR